VLSATAPGTIEWRACADGGTVCVPLPAGAYGPAPAPNSAIARPGDTVAGTVFEAVATDGPEVSTARTPAWRGKVGAIPPAVIGEPTVGRQVGVTGDTWTGGWSPPATERTGGFLAACRQPTGGECVVLSYVDSGVPVPSGSVTIDAAWTGWYLLAQEYRQSGSVIAMPQYAAPPVRLTVPLRAGGSAALSDPVGPIAAAPVVSKPAPTAAVRRRALRRKGRLAVARVTCPERCTVRLTVSGGGRRKVRRTLHVLGTKSLTVPVRHGRLKVRVIVDGKVLASARTRAR
jgi:hypothetical protein